MALPPVVGRDEWLTARREFVELDLLPQDGERSRELAGISCFLQAGEEVFHTYSTYARGMDHLAGTYPLLDLTALGRQEDWEEPQDRDETVKSWDPDAWKSCATPDSSRRAHIRGRKGRIRRAKRLMSRAWGAGRTAADNQYATVRPACQACF
jgi:hypothetical protein